MVITSMNGVQLADYDEANGIGYFWVNFSVKNVGTQSADLVIASHCHEYCDPFYGAGYYATIAVNQTVSVRVELSVPVYPYTYHDTTYLTTYGRVGGTVLPGADSMRVHVNLSAPVSADVVPWPPKLAPAMVALSPHSQVVSIADGQTGFGTVTISNTSSAASGQIRVTPRCDALAYSGLSEACAATASYLRCPMASTGSGMSMTCSLPAGGSIPVTLQFYGDYYGHRVPMRLVVETPDTLTGAWIADSATVTAAIGAQVLASVGPKSAGKTVPPGLARSDTFTVKNGGTASGSISLVASCGSFSACSLDQSTITVGAGDSAKIHVSYIPSTTNGTTAMIRLIASAVSQTDTGTYSITALDATAPVISISGPANGSTQTSRAYAPTVSVCDDGVIGKPTVTFNGTTLPDMFLRQTQSGCFSAGSSSFALLAQPGPNTLSVTVSDGYHTSSTTRTFSYDDATDVTPVVAALISNQVVPTSETWPDTFTVQNPGPIGASYSFSAICEVSLCYTEPESLTIASGATAKVVVQFFPTGAPATILFTASHTSATGHTVSSSASTFTTTANGAFPQIALSPSDGSSYVTPQITAAANWCDPDDAITSRQVWLNGTLLPDTFVPKTVAGCAFAGTSTWTGLTLVPWAQDLVAQATDAAGHVVRVAHTLSYQSDLRAFAPAVTPQNTARTVARGVVSTQAFFVKNAGAYNATYDLTASCGSFTVCVADRSTIGLAPGAGDSIRVSFYAPTAIGSFSPIRLVARYSNGTTTIADSGQVTVSTPTAAELYQPRVVAGIPLALVTPSWIMGLPFNVTNTGAEAATYALSTATTGGWGFPLDHMPPSTITLAPSETVSLLLQPRAPAVSNVTGRVTVTASLTASDGTRVASTDFSTLQTSDASASLSVLAESPSSVVPRDGGVYQRRFAVRDPGSVQINATLSVTCTGLARECSTYPTALVPAGGSESIPVTFRAGTDSAGTITLRATGVFNGQTLTDSAVMTLTAVATGIKAVAVSPDSVSQLVSLSRSDRQTFTISNLGTGAAYYRYTVSCPPSSGALQSCKDTSAVTARVEAGSAAAITVPYRTASTGGLTGKIALTAVDASDAAVLARGVASFATVAPLPIQVRLAEHGLTPTIARDQCLTIAAGPATAYECGDLRAVHALPATTTLGQPRAPTLLYASQTQSGVLLFAADVSVAPGYAVTSVHAHVTFAGFGPVDMVVPWDSSWSNGAPRRVIVPVSMRAMGLATGVYSYTFSADAVSGTATLQHAVTGTVAFVNRETSSFGPGWWLDGLEQLFAVDTSHKLWVGGDGSTRLYTRASDTVWTVQPTLERPDSLLYRSASWQRRLRNGAYVQFDNLGRHLATVNRFGHVTTFNYEDPSNVRRLTSIDLPLPAGATAPTASRRYRFYYGAVTGPDTLLTQVEAPPMNGVARTVTVGHVPGTNLVSSFSGPAPDTTSVRYGYALVGGLAHMTSRRDRRGFTTSFVFDSVSHTLVRDSLDMQGTGANIVQAFCAAEASGLVAGCVTSPMDTISVITSFNGPRADVNDVTTFRVNRWGAPMQITDALGRPTYIERGDGRWPLLVTKTTAPSGLVTRASYNARGVLQAQTVENPYDTRPSTTIYQWNEAARFDQLDVIIAPTGEYTRFGYYPNGDRWWQEDIRGSVSRATFTYNSNRQVATVQAPGRTTAQLQRYLYDSTGTGNLIRSISPRGVTTRYHLDALGRVDSVYAPIDATHERVQGMVYDVNDRVIEQLDSGPAMGTGVPASWLRVANRYDADGNVTRVSQWGAPDPSAIDSVVRAFSYDGASRRISEGRQFPGGYYQEAFHWAYDEAGNVTTGGHDALGVILGYDALNRLVSRSGAHSATYTYDPLTGQLATANNAAARISRTYYPNGQLKTDTLKIASADTAIPSFPHVYVQSMTYELDGSRKTLTLPTQLGGGGTVSYDRDPANGNITITDRLGGNHRYTFTPDGSVSTVTVNRGRSDQVIDSSAYDADGRKIDRFLNGSSFEHLTYNDADQLLDVSGNSFVYDGRGRVVQSWIGSNLEIMSLDAFGNVWHKGGPQGVQSDSYYAKGRGTLDTVKTQGVAAAMNISYYGFDHLGNSGGVLSLVAGSRSLGGMAQEDFTFRTNTQEMYDDRNKLTLHRFQFDTVFATVDRAAYPDTPSSAWVYRRDESYRYDALGRRVWTRVVRDSVECRKEDSPEKLSGCASTVTRTIWDGDQILGEIRSPGGELATAAELENDNAVGDYVGQVTYLHGIGIDAPLLLDKNAEVVIPIANWRGEFVRGYCNGSECLDSHLKFESPTIYGSGRTFTPSWYGSLIASGEDGSGYRYRRNRYYDPQTGRFTQEDPIGLTGGLNLYAFGGGDPVTYSDPFGLDPCKASSAWTECLAQAIADWGAAKGGAAGNTAVNLGAALNAGLEALGLNAAASAGDAIGSGRLAEGGVQAALVFALPGGGGGAAERAIAGKITGFTKHGLNQAISRDGVGVASEAILGAVKNPTKMVQQAGGKVKYIGENATVILNQAGEVVTTWARNSAGWRIRP